jgi:hypothetical protein
VGTWEEEWNDGKELGIAIARNVLPVTIALKQYPGGAGRNMHACVAFASPCLKWPPTVLGCVDGKEW